MDPNVVILSFCLFPSVFNAELWIQTSNQGEIQIET